MAEDGEEETEYESDPEEAKMSLKMRRREASDDEDSEEDEEEEERERDLRAEIVDSEVESDGQGGAAEYDEEEYYDELEEEFEEEREIDDGNNGGSGGGGEADVMGGEVGGAKAVEEETTNEGVEATSQGQVEKKETEPSSVPTSGAFYMHDDRFRDNAGGKHRRTFGRARLWESKDDRKWGHDKYEEVNTQERHYVEGRRSSKGYYRGRGKARVADRGHVGGNRMRGYDGNSNQNSAPKDVRGRGPRRYQPSMKSKSETLSPQNKQSAKSLDKTFHSSSGRISGSTSNQIMEHEPIPAKKTASNLNSASPPFYPSGSSNNGTPLTQKKGVQSGNHIRNIRPSSGDDNFSMPLSNSLVRGKNVIDSIGMDKLHVDDYISTANAKHLKNVHLPSLPLSSLGATHTPQSRPQGRVLANNSINKVLQPVAQVSQRNPVQNRNQPAIQVSGQQLTQRPVDISEGSSPPKPGKVAIQGTGRGSFVFDGAQVMGSSGNMVGSPGDQNLPAFLPVMQFGNQHPGGMGVPALGMAFPGYVAQPNGLANPEMRWLPVLASAASAMGGPYCPPYSALDGTYHPRPTGQTSTLPAPSKDNNLSKPNNELKPQQRSDVANDDFSQRQNKPRRYSEMSFSQ